MSLLNAPAPYRRRGQPGIRVPVVLPLVAVTINDTGRLSISVDGVPYAADDTLTRADLTRVVDEIATDLDTPVRVEVHETDGSTFTDIITPPEPPPISVSEPEQAPDPPLEMGPAGVAGSAPRVALASAFGVYADGFHPGEPVEICLVVAHHLADEDGTAHLRLPPALLQAHPRVVLLGRASGVVAVNDAPAAEVS